MVKGYEILELSGQGRYLYTEGHHPKVDVLDGTPGLGGWFCFEPDGWVDAAMQLQRIGFTATQILEARKYRSMSAAAQEWDRLDQEEEDEALS